MVVGALFGFLEGFFDGVGGFAFALEVFGKVFLKLVGGWLDGCVVIMVIDVSGEMVIFRAG